MKYVGRKLKSLLVLSEKSNGRGKHKTLVCQCDCGEIKEVQSHNFKVGKHCPCKKHLYNDLSGKYLGKVRVVSLEKRSQEFTNKQGHLYKCECSQCKKVYYYHTSTLSRKGFKGCLCKEDNQLSSKKYWFRVYKANAKKRSLEFKLTFEQFIEICNSPCHYTKQEGTILVNKKDLLGIWICNGIDRVDNSKGYLLSNVVPCAKVVNRMKGDLQYNEFLNIVETIYENKIKKL